MCVYFVIYQLPCNALLIYRSSSPNKRLCIIPKQSVVFMQLFQDRYCSSHVPVKSSKLHHVFMEVKKVQRKKWWWIIYICITIITVLFWNCPMTLRIRRVSSIELPCSLHKKSRILSHCCGVIWLLFEHLFVLLRRWSGSETKSFFFFLSSDLFLCQEKHIIVMLITVSIL